MEKQVPDIQVRGAQCTGREKCVDPGGDLILVKNSRSCVISPHRIENHNPAMTSSQVRKAFKNAWRLWSNFTPLRFLERRGKEADIMIAFKIGGDH